MQMRGWHRESLEEPHMQNTKMGRSTNTVLKPGLTALTPPCNHILSLGLSPCHIDGILAILDLFLAQSISFSSHIFSKKPRPRS